MAKEKRFVDYVNIIDSINANKSDVSFLFEFSQNNSYGRFDINENVSGVVFIEAYSHDHANALAEDIGLYFNGCDTGRDCDCCGDRWHPVEQNDGITIEEFNKNIHKQYYDFRIHMINGTILSSGGTNEGEIYI